MTKEDRITWSNPLLTCLTTVRRNFSGILTGKESVERVLESVTKWRW